MNYFKPVLKKVLKLKEIFCYDYKVLKLKRKKWKNFLIMLRSSNLNKKFSKYKFIDQKKLLLYPYSNKYSDYKNEYKHHFFFTKIFCVFYLNIFKKQIKQLKTKDKIFLLNFFENRLDFILFRSKFGLTLRFIRKCIVNNIVFVNNKNVSKSSNLYFNDLINFTFYFKKYENNLVYSKKWPLPVNNLIINYNIKLFIFLGSLKTIHFFSLFPYYLKLESVFF